jgi:micrococcal nuclease
MAILAIVLIRGCDPSPPHPAGFRGPDPPPGSRTTAHVTHVTDGDTITVYLNGREEEVRLIGIDTPETVDPDEPVQCFGPEASAFTRARLQGATVELVPGAERRDAYGRLLAYIYVDGAMFNAALARRGLGRPLAIAPNDTHAARFERLAAQAARQGRGLWGACDGD